MGDDCLVTTVNFFHSISLKDSPIRHELMPPAFTAFLISVFGSERFYDWIDSKRFGQFFSALSKFHSNVKEIDGCIYQTVVRSVKAIDRDYKQLAEDYNNQSLQDVRQGEEQSQGQGQGEQVWRKIQERCRYIDRRLIGVVKLEEKSRGGILENINPFNFAIYLRTLARMAVSRPIMLSESPYDNKILVNAIQETTRNIQEYMRHIADKFKHKSNVFQEPKEKQE